MKRGVKQEKRRHADSFLLPYSSLSFGAPLGAGAYGTVLRASLDGMPVAVKSVRAVSNDARSGFVDREAESLSKLHHPHCCLFIGIALREEPRYRQHVYIVMELLGNGDLYRAIATPLRWQRKVLSIDPIDPAKLHR